MMDCYDGEERGRCLECGNILPPGRKDMKFCCRSCRSRWNYRTRGRYIRLRDRIVRTLDRNHSVLDCLLESGVRKIAIPDLGRLGYSFDCITSYRKVGKHEEYRCYDIKYCMSGNNVFKIERCQPPASDGLSGDP